MTVALLPDVELLLVNFNLAQPELSALVGTNIFTELPKTKSWPALRVTRYSGTPRIGRPLWLDEALVQVDCWGGTKNVAWQIAETTRALWAARLAGSHTEGVISSVDFGELRDEADDTVPTVNGAARPRFLFTATVRCHS